MDAILIKFPIIIEALKLCFVILFMVAGIISLWWITMEPEHRKIIWSNRKKIAGLIE